MGDYSGVSAQGGDRDNGNGTEDDTAASEQRTGLSNDRQSDDDQLFPRRTVASLAVSKLLNSPRQDEDDDEKQRQFAGSQPTTSQRGPLFGPVFTQPPPAAMVQYQTTRLPLQHQLPQQQYQPPFYPAQQHPPRNPLGADPLRDFANLVVLPYTLSVRQHPIRARSCGSGDKDRRPVDPTPVVELHQADGVDINAERNDHFIVSAELLTEDGQLVQEKLTGEMCSAPFRFAEEGRRQPISLVFCFSDLSVRREGSYRLRFSAYNIADCKNGPSPILATVTTDVFLVYSPANFPGMLESGLLSRQLAAKGAKITVRSDVRIGPRTP